MQQLIPLTPPCSNFFFFTFRYDARKGFFCQVVNGDHTKCLGRSKGRHYPAMDVQSAKYLQVITRMSNFLIIHY